MNSMHDNDMGPEENKPQTPPSPTQQPGGSYGGQYQYPANQNYQQQSGWYGQQSGYGYTQQTQRQQPYTQPQNQFYGTAGQPRNDTPGTGWQQTAPQKYEWDFEQYEKVTDKKEKKKRTRGPVVFAVALLCLLSVGLISFSGYGIWKYNMDNGENSTAALPLGENDDAQAEDAARLHITPQPEASETSRPAASSAGRLTVPEIAEKVLPSVVGIVKYESNSRILIESGAGSGIIMDAEGHIITNAHVVEGGVEFKVQLNEEEVYEAKLIGSDPSTDLAVLKINAPNLIPAEFGDSTALKVGETVVAIGNPSGIQLAGSVTRGIVSALNRKYETSDYSHTYIQTDAAINPGNSGGALVNEFGQIIGINSAKIVATGYEGISFAIPIAEAQPIIDELLENGRVTGRVMLGITCVPVDEIDARTYDLKEGLQISEIRRGSDLSRTDVQVGDIITHIDGERIYGLADVTNILRGHEPGDSVTLTIYRRLSAVRDTSFDVKITLMEEGNLG